MAIQPTRRRFLRSAPLAVAAVSLPLRETFAPAPLEAQADAPAPAPFKFYPAADLKADQAALEAKPGNNNLWDNAAVPFTVVMTTEKKHEAKEFEWHEGRDHILQVIDGSCVYEVGGKPVGAHSSKPGEWNAPSATGSTKMTLKKGDMLVIPRDTLHKRTTDESVTFYLISTTGKA